MNYHCVLKFQQCRQYAKQGKRGSEWTSRNWILSYPLVHDHTLPRPQLFFILKFLRVPSYDIITTPEPSYPFSGHQSGFDPHTLWHNVCSNVSAGPTEHH